MQPRYVTLTSSGISPWQLTNWQGNPPMQIGFAITVASLSSQYLVEVTLADPTLVYPSTVTTVFSASAIGGPVTSSLGQIASISTCPVAAWRLNVSSTGGSVHVAALQAGIG